MMLNRKLALVAPLVAALVDRNVKVPDELSEQFEEFFNDKVTGQKWVDNPTGVAQNVPAIPGQRPTGYPGNGFVWWNGTPEYGFAGVVRNPPMGKLSGDWNLLVSGKAPPKHDNKAILFVEPVKFNGDAEGPSERIRELAKEEDDKDFVMKEAAAKSVTKPGDYSPIVEYETENSDVVKVLHVAPVQGQTDEDWKAGEEANLRAYYGALKTFVDAPKLDHMVLPLLGCQDWNVPNNEQVEGKEAGADYPGSPAHSGNLATRELGTLFLAYLALPEDSKKALKGELEKGNRENKVVEFWRNGGQSTCEMGMQHLNTHGLPFWFDLPEWKTASSLVEDDNKRDHPHSRWSVMRVAMRLAEKMGYDYTKLAEFDRLRTEKLEQGKQPEPETKPAPKTEATTAPKPETKPEAKPQPKATTTAAEKKTWGWMPWIAGGVLVLGCVVGVVACLMCRSSVDVDSDL